MIYIQQLLKDIYTLCTTVRGGTNNIEIEEEILNTDESISTLSEQLSVTPECLALPLNEVSESLVRIAEILDQVPPIA